MRAARRLDAEQYVAEMADDYASAWLKFSDDDVLAMPNDVLVDLAEVARYWLVTDAADHPFAFVQDMRRRALAGEPISARSLRGVANCMLRAWGERLNGHRPPPDLTFPDVPF